MSSCYHNCAVYLYSLICVISTVIITDINITIITLIAIGQLAFSILCYFCTAADRLPLLVCLSVRLSPFLSNPLCLCLCMSVSVCLSFCLSVCLLVSLSLTRSLLPSLPLPLSLSICVSPDVTLCGWLTGL